MSNESNTTISKYLGPDFQQKLIWQLLVEPDFAKNVLPQIAVEYFDDPYLKKLFLVMLEYYQQHDKVPNLQNGSIDDAIYKYSKGITNETDSQVLKGKVDQIRLWNEKVINKNQLYDGDVVREDTVNFIKQQEYRKLAEYIINKTKTGEIRTTAFNFEVEEKINKIYHIGDEEDYGTDAVDNIDHALSEEFRETIPTGIKAIDDVTGQGLGKGEIGLVLAPSGIGKTTFLTKIANSGVNNGNKVLHIVFEDTIKQIQRKHYAIWSKTKLSDIDDNREYVREKVIENYKSIKEKGGKLDIVRFSQEDTTIHEIKNWIARQEKKFGYKYNMIVLDYLDCLEPNKKEKELLSAELQIIKSFEAMAADYDIPCWSAIQTNRSGFSAEFVELESTGGNIKRVQKSHFVMSIAKPDKGDNSDLANLKILKARFAEDGQEFKETIFNNDSLEIRVTDNKYLKKLKTKKYNDNDLEKTENKVKKYTENNDNSTIDESYHHAKVSEYGYDHSKTIADVSNENISNDLNLNQSAKDKYVSGDTVNISGTTRSTNSQTQINKNESNEQVKSEPVSGSTQEVLPKETGEEIKEIDPEVFFSNNTLEDEKIPNHEIDSLMKKREKQGDVIKSSKKT